MIGSTRSVRVFALTAPVDMRKGFDGLHALVVSRLAKDPLSGDLYLFTSRDRRRAKVLLWDGTGLCVFSKRLERSRFACLWRDGPGGSLTLTTSELGLYLEGCSLVGRVPMSPPELKLHGGSERRP